MEMQYQERGNSLLSVPKSDRHLRQQNICYERNEETVMEDEQMI